MVIPRPASSVRREGSFVIGPETVVRGPEHLAAMVRRELGPATGLPLASDGADDGGRIEVHVDPTLGREAYRLSAAGGGIRITGGDAAGAFYAVQTLRQLLPAAIYRQAPLPGVRWQTPAVEIEDAPRFSWRGGMLDVGRHFMPKDFLFRYVDLLALHKFNVFHLHLTEDQGWRFESRAYPRLLEVGAWRTQTLEDGTPHGGFYTQDDLRELVAYAAERFITVVPEIDMPGHMRAAVASYPTFGNQPADPVDVGTRWGVMEDVLNVEEPTLRFCTNILDELIEVFPSRFVHIGGDECPTTQWARSERARQRMRDLGIADVEEIQGWFTRRIGAHLTERGRQLIGWDEIADHGPVPGATVMAWRTPDHGVAAARLGYDVIMAPYVPTYLYIGQADAPDEPGSSPYTVDLNQVYDYEPISTQLERGEARRVLGTQFHIWTERIPTPHDVEYMAYPRACALAEVAWSRPEKDRADFRRRLDAHLPRLDALRVNYRPPAGARPWQLTGKAPNRRG